jgi:hypothetical protein
VTKKLGFDNSASSSEQLLVDEWLNQGIVEILLRTHCTVEKATLNTIADAGPVYFDGVAMLVFLLLCGGYLQLRGQRAAADSAELLFSLMPSTARVVSPPVRRETPAEGLVPGDVIDGGGDTLPADGLVESGVSSVNVALLSAIASVTTGQDAVYSGTLNLSRRSGCASQAGESSRRADRGASRGARRHRRAVRHRLRLVHRGARWRPSLRRQIDPSAIDNAVALLTSRALALARLAVTASIGRAAHVHPDQR